MILCLTESQDSGSFEKFAPKRRSLQYKQTKSALRIKFEDSRAQVRTSIQGSRSGESPSRIFDKLVERASREMRSGLA